MSVDALSALVPWLVAYAASGALVGMLAGLLGIGGGMVLVPILSALFAMQGLGGPTTVQFALGTAMASMMFTSSASVREHHRHGVVDWTLVRGMAPAMVVGTLASTLASGFVPQQALAIAFAVIVTGGATQILLGRKPSAARGLPGPAGLLATGAIIGLVCGLVSAGGAFLSVPFMLWCSVPVRTAIGTAAALGIPVAVVGTIGFITSGLVADARPEGGLAAASLGFVYLPALAALVAASVLTAPVGARWAHRLPVATLRRAFALLLYALAIKMAIGYA